MYGHPVDSDEFWEPIPKDVSHKMNILRDMFYLIDEIDEGGDLPTIDGFHKVILEAKRCGLDIDFLRPDFFRAPSPPKGARNWMIGGMVTAKQYVWMLWHINDGDTISVATTSLFDRDIEEDYVFADHIRKYIEKAGISNVSFELLGDYPISGVVAI